MERSVKVYVKRDGRAAGLPLPGYMSEAAAGLDLYAAVQRDIVLMPGERRLVPTGIRIELPRGYEAQIRPRSGLALRYGLSIVNAPGTIDADYRGEIGVILINLGEEPVRIARGDRIAQMVIAPVARAELIEVDELGATERAEGGFGHTDGL